VASSEPAWWPAVTVGRGTDIWTWGSEIALPAGTPLALTLRWPPGLGVSPGALGLELHLPPDLGELEGAEDAGLVVRLDPPSGGARQANREWVSQFAGRRTSGETILALTYEGRLVAGAEGLLCVRLTTADQSRYDYTAAALGTMAQGSGVIGHEVSALQRQPALQVDARWTPIRTAYEQLVQALPPILSSPQQDLQRTVRLVDWSASAARMPLLAGGVPAPGTPWRQLPGGTGQAGRRVPERLLLRSVQATRDVPANRYVRDTLERLVEEARALEKGAGQQEAGYRQRAGAARHPRWRDRLEERAGRYAGLAASARHLRWRITECWLQHPVLRDLVAAPPRATDLVWRDNAYYRRVRIIRATLERELRALEDTLFVDTTLGPAASINELYELWVVQTVLTSLCTRFGYRLLSKGGRPVPEGAATERYRLNRGSRAELRAPSGRRVVVHFDQEFPAVYTDADLRRHHYGVDRRRWPQAKGRPDLALEVWDDEGRAAVPRIVVWDATWSRQQETQVTKYLYRESIRDFTRLGVSGQPDRPVVASWVVYPGSAEAADYEDDYRTGLLPLDPGPGAEEVLTEYLGPLLRLAGAS
jgi:hypothetical protein